MPETPEPPPPADQSQQNGARPNKPVLSAPKHKGQQHQPTPSKDGDLLSSAVFVPDGIAAYQQSLATSFSVNYTGYVDFVDEVYRRNELVSKDFPKSVSIETFQYYCVCMFWLRQLSIKRTRGRVPLTEIERSILDTFTPTSFVVPKPLYAYLSALGDVTSPTGEKLIYREPSLGTAVRDGVGGFVADADVDANTHILYEEIPYVGVAAHVLRASSNINLLNPFPIPSPLGNGLNRNCLGFRLQTSVRKAQQVSILQNYGIQAGEPFPDVTAGAAFCPDILSHVAQMLTEYFVAFDLKEFSVPNQPCTGSLAQLIPLHPTNWIGGTQRVKDAYVVAKSLWQPEPTQLGVSVAFAFQLWKENNPNAPAVPINQRTNAWCCITATADHPIPQAWIVNRNQRRDLPARYHSDVYVSAERLRSQYVTLVIEAMLTVNKRK